MHARLALQFQSHPRHALQWRKKYAEFSRTLPGQAVFLTFIFFLFRSGIIWKMLNLLFIAWWLAPFLFFVIGKFSPKVMRYDSTLPLCSNGL